MTRLMYDSVNASAIPRAARMVAGYVDGRFAWSAADWALFPSAVRVRIAVFTSTNDGHVLDCEPGNNTPAESVDWVLMRRKAAVDPTVYCGRNTWWQQIRAAFQARGVPEPHYWVADYSVNQTAPAIPDGAIGLQYRDAGSYDLSVMADYWPGIDPHQEADMPLTDQELGQIVNGARDQVLNHPVGEIDLAGKATGSTVSLGTIAARARAAQADLDARLTALSAAVAKLQAPQVDQAALEAALQNPAVAGAFADALLARAAAKLNGAAG